MSPRHHTHTPDRTPHTENGNLLQPPTVLLPDDGDSDTARPPFRPARGLLMARPVTPLLPRLHASGNRPTVSSVLIYDAALMLAWTGAWLVHNAVGPSPRSEGIDTLFWTVAKLLVWLLP